MIAHRLCLVQYLCERICLWVRYQAASWGIVELPNSRLQPHISILLVFLFKNM